MSVAIVLEETRGRGNGWKAIVYPVDGYNDHCDSCHNVDHSNPSLGCPYAESEIQKNPYDAISQAVIRSEQKAEKGLGEWGRRQRRSVADNEIKTLAETLGN